jgi:hypothetical protein
MWKRILLGVRTPFLNKIFSKKQLITAIPVHNISNICYAKEAENSHVIAIQNGIFNNKSMNFLLKHIYGFVFK